MKKSIVFFLLALILVGAMWAGGAQDTKKAATAEKPKLQFASWMVAEASGGEKIIPERIKVWLRRRAWMWK